MEKQFLLKSSEEPILSLPPTEVHQHIMGVSVRVDKLQGPNCACMQCLWESAGSFSGPKHSHMVNMLQVCVFPWRPPCALGPVLGSSHPAAGTRPAWGSACPPALCCPAGGSPRAAVGAGQELCCSWGFVCGWRTARVQMGAAEKGRSEA